MGMVSRYKFNEGSGLVSSDASGNGYTLTPNHTTDAWVASGKVGSAARYQHAGKFGPNVANNDWSILCWINRGIGSNSYQQFWGQSGASGGNGDHWTECLNSGATFPLYWWSGGASIDAGFSLSASTWYHLACVVSGTNRKMYVDGVLKVDSTNAAHPTGVNFNNGTWFAGSRWGDTSNVTDDLITFDHALTQAEIQTWMAASATESSPQGNFFNLFST